MTNECRQCGKKLEESFLTHCSEKCIFENMKNTKSLTNTPFKEWPI